MFNNSTGLDSDSDLMHMHDLMKKRNKRNALVLLAVAALFAVFRTVLTRLYVDPDIHFYTEASARFFDYAVAAGIIALYVGSAFAYRYKKGSTAGWAHFVQGTQTLVFTASVTGFLLAASAVLQVWGMFANAADSLPASEVFANYIGNNPFAIFIFAAAILSAVYFFRTAALNQDAGADMGSAGAAKPAGEGADATDEDEREGERESDGEANGGGSAESAAIVSQPFAAKQYSQRYIILSIAPIAWAFLHTFRCFFDMSRSVNSPVKVYELMCFLALSAYFVAESRMVVGKLEIGKFFTLSYIAIILTALSALPNLILSSFWIMQTNNPPIIYAVQIAAALYVAARVYSQIRYGRFMLYADESDEDEEEKSKGQKNANIAK